MSFSFTWDVAELECDYVIQVWRKNLKVLEEEGKKYTSPPVLVPECLNGTTGKCKYTYLNATVDCTVDQRFFREQMLCERERQPNWIYGIMPYKY